MQRGPANHPGTTKRKPLTEEKTEWMQPKKQLITGDHFYAEPVGTQEIEGRKPLDVKTKRFSAGGETRVETRRVGTTHCKQFQGGKKSKGRKLAKCPTQRGGGKGKQNA